MATLPRNSSRWDKWRVDTACEKADLKIWDYCSDGGDSSALSGQTLLCSGIVFALESEVLGSNLRTDSALQLGMRMLRKNPCCYLCGYIFHHRLWGRNVVMEVILLHFWIRPFCVVVSSSLWNRRSRVRISKMTRHFTTYSLWCNKQVKFHCIDVEILVDDNWSTMKYPPSSYLQCHIVQSQLI